MMPIEKTEAKREWLALKSLSEFSAEARFKPRKSQITARCLCHHGAYTCSAILTNFPAPVQPQCSPKMYFFFSDKVILLFEFWNVHSPAGMVLSVFVIMLLAVLYETIKVGKAKLLQRTMPAMAPSISQEALEPERASVNTSGGQLTHTSKNWFLWHSVQSLIHVVQVVLGYLIMLAVMSYNTWIFLGVIAGSAIGYYLAYPLLTTR